MAEAARHLRQRVAKLLMAGPLAVDDEENGDAGEGDEEHERPPVAQRANPGAEGDIGEGDGVGPRPQTEVVALVDLLVGGVGGVAGERDSAPDVRLGEERRADVGEEVEVGPGGMAGEVVPGEDDGALKVAAESGRGREAGDQRGTEDDGQLLLREGEPSRDAAGDPVPDEADEHQVRDGTAGKVVADHQGAGLADVVMVAGEAGHDEDAEQPEQDGTDGDGFAGGVGGRGHGRETGKGAKIRLRDGIKASNQPRSFTAGESSPS